MEHKPNLNEFRKDVLYWANYINLIKGGDPLKQIDKIQEELNEYREAVEKEDYHHAGEELVDILVTCLVSSEQLGIELAPYQRLVIDKLMSRKDTGKMVNGVFIKAEDLEDPERWPI